MINLFKLKKKQKEKDVENSENNNAANQTVKNKKKKKLTAGEIRLLKDLSELNDVYESVTVSFPNDADDIMNFQVLISPDEGYYKGGEFLFSFEVSSIYPHDPPKVKCNTKIIHPNIDLEGKVCLNVLREDWSPVLNINVVVSGLFHLFTNPNFDDPLNHDAAAVLKQRQANGYVGRRRWEP